MREAELMARDRWTRDDLLAFQGERLRALLAHAVTHSRYYREALGADAAERPLTDLPTLSKATLMAEFDHSSPIRCCDWPTFRLTSPAQIPCSPFLARTAWRPRPARPGGGRSLCLRPRRLRHGARPVVGPCCA
jgi:hypothetical protein